MHEYYRHVPPKEAVTLLTVLQGVPLPHVMAGVAAFAGLCWLFKRDKQENEPLENPYRENLTVEPTVNQPSATVRPTVAETVNPTVQEPLETVVEPFDGDEWSDEDEWLEEMDAEEAEREQLRSVMSALGKKSVEARRRKKLTAQKLDGLPL